jgi:hypothetical protein
MPGSFSITISSLSALNIGGSKHSLSTTERCWSSRNRDRAPA